MLFVAKFCIFCIQQELPKSKLNQIPFKTQIIIQKIIPQNFYKKIRILSPRFYPFKV